ncbi:MAG: 3,4-dihydroxy-2-butanone-4-phosphate synthase [Deltaproteobacteria bacterium]|nr:3,4-dihydroxy-2-butanone-4-phosphate synthase [Deltaproteobacteria bacterium]
MKGLQQTNAIERVRRAIEEIRAGRMVILVDDEDRENEGDLTMAAELVTPEAVTFMATKGCGLICVTLVPDQVERLGLKMMVDDNRAALGTAFTVSIEAASGVSTGISAADRARTIRVAVDPASGPADIVSPGHVFPLRAMPGGVLQRTGQTEGSVDLSRLAGFRSAGVICEIMNPDGSMARMPDLERFAGVHGLLIVSIADLIEYRLRRDRLIERTSVTELELGGEERKARFTAYVYKAAPGVRRREFVALVLGDVANGEPVPCRAHVGSLIDDVFLGHTRRRSPSIGQVIDAIIRRGRGVILYLPSRETIEDEVTRHGGAGDPDRAARDHGGEIREYGIGAQILLDLGVRRLLVISNNPHKLVGLTAYGFESVTQITMEEV